MTPGSFTLTGVKEMRQALGRFPDESVQAMQKVARQAALRVKDRARALVPVDTGITRDSIDVQPDHANKQYKVGVFASPPHVRKGRDSRTAYLPNLAIWLEFGTTRKPARPFLRPALDAESASYKAAMQTEIDALMQKTFG